MPLLDPSGLYQRSGGQARVERLSGIEDPDLGSRAKIALAEAEAELRSYLLKQYTPEQLEAQPTPEVVLSKLADLGLYHLLRNIHDRVPDDVVRQRDEAIGWLGRVARRIASLELPGSPLEDNHRVSVHISKPPSGPFTDGGLDEWG